MNLFIPEPKKQQHCQYSGGASGADFHWILSSKHNSVVMSFKEHKPILPFVKDNVKVCVLSDYDLNKGRLCVENVALLGKRQLKFTSPLSFGNKLILRNYYQVKNATSVYAIGYLSKKRTKLKALNIMGGTFWACQMFCVKYSLYGTRLIPLYFFDQTSKKWYQCAKSNFLFQWVDLPKVPVPTGKYASIGSRKLLECGKEQIKAVYGL